MKSTVIVNLRINSAFKTYLFVIWYYQNPGALNSCQSRALWRNFLNKLYCKTSKRPAEIRVVISFIRIKPNNKSRKLLFKYFLRVKFFLKIHIVVIFIFLHSSSPCSSTKSTLLKSDFNDPHPHWGREFVRAGYTQIPSLREGKSHKTNAKIESTGPIPGV